jgi:hypothetical protein
MRVHLGITLMTTDHYDTMKRASMLRLCERTNLRVAFCNVYRLQTRVKDYAKLTLEQV